MNRSSKCITDIDLSTLQKNCFLVLNRNNELLSTSYKANIHIHDFVAVLRNISRMFVLQIN